MSDNRPIGVFDSGLGGLSVIKELTKVLPDEKIVYFGDTGRVPYGTRSADTIIKYARQDERFLLSHDVKLIIAACGTVSAVAESTGNELPVPFIEVVTPAALAAVNSTKNNKIGVIGTTATIRSGAYEKKIKQLSPDIEVISNDCPLLVPLVEAGWIERNDKVTVETARRYLQDIINFGVDTLILGCTHFPALKEIIGDICGESVTLINTGEQAARKAEYYLKTAKALSNDGTVSRHFYVSDHTDSFAKTASILLESDIKDDVEMINIESFGG